MYLRICGATFYNFYYHRLYCVAIKDMKEKEIVAIII